MLISWATKRSTVWLNGVLALLAIALLACQSIYSVDIVSLYLHAMEVARVPIEYSNGKKILEAEPEARAAGLGPGDRLERINGIVVDGRRLLQKTLADNRAGARIELQVLRPSGERRVAWISLAPLADEPTTSRQWWLVVVGFTLAPLLALGLGFAVVLLRRSDERAWILLGLLASFSQLLHIPETEGSIPAAVLLLRIFLSASLGIWLVMFAGHFPERSHWILRRPWLRWFVWSPLLFSTGLVFLARTLELHHLSLLERWDTPLHRLQQLHLFATLAAVAWYFSELGMKTRRAVGDAYRRLKILWISTFISFAPVFLLAVIGAVRGRDPLAVSVWMVLPAILALDVFPCALAYVIVVRKAVEPNVILRQSMQYALARRSLPVVRIGVIGALFGVLIRVISQASLSRSGQVKAALAIGAVTLLLDHGLTSRVTLWVDDYFFRKGYDVEQILTTFAHSGFREPQAVLDFLEEIISDGLQVSRTSIFLLDQGVYRSRHRIGDGDAQEVILPAGSALVECLLEQDHPWLIDHDDPGLCIQSLHESERNCLAALGAEVVIPLRGKTRPLGFWILGRKKSEEPYSRKDLKLLHSVSVQASLALENSFLLQSLEQEITERERKHAEKDGLEKASKAKSEFIAKMSHELRTPLNAIIGYSEMLQEDAADTGSQSFVLDLEKITAAAKHLLSLINSILDISKIEAGKMELYIETFSIEKLVTDTVSIVRPLIGKNGNELRRSFAPGLGTMVADAVKLRQTLFNLLSNAAKFTEKGAIDLAVAAETDSGAEMICFRVSDTGIGITPEQIEKLLVPFAQADSSISSKYGGTGLGLAICRHFCQMMGGDIALESRFGHGTTVTVRLPRVVKIAQTPLPCADPLERIPMEDYSGTVLVIDDDPMTCECIRRGLHASRARVVGANSGQEGLQAARRLRPDLITLDVLMDGMDGWEVLAQLKSDPVVADIPVVMITVTDERNKALFWRVAECLVKPVNRKELTAVLGKYLPKDQGVGQAGEILLVDDDDGTRRLMKILLQEEGWKVKEAQNGRIGISSIQERKPDLIFLDLVMPEMDGFTFLSELRKSPHFAEIPVVVLTSKDLNPTDRQILSAGAAQVLLKTDSSLDEVVAGVGTQFASQLRMKDRQHG